MSYKILIVDDNVDHLKASEILLKSRGYNNVDTAANGFQAIEKIKASPWKYGLVILDYLMEGKNGAETAEAILSITPNLYVVIHSADQTQEAAIRTIDSGAVGFILKSPNSEVYLQKVALWCKKYEDTYLPISPSFSANEHSKAIQSEGLIGASKGLADVISRAKRYAPLKDTVLIEGETGTGKERIARILHQGPRESYFPVNCATWNGSTELMESDLFGHRKGAFTGADVQHLGVFRRAQGGTIVLDEIDTLGRDAQAKLLRVIREKTVRPVGVEIEYPVDFRLVLTAKPGIEKRVKEEKFMLDFFQRINVLRISIPPLRDRLDDVGPLVAYFCDLYEKDYGKKKRFLPQTLDYLKRYDWPGNVAELEHRVRRLCVDADGDTILPKHLSEEFFKECPLVSLNDQLQQIAREEMFEAIKHANTRREASRSLGIPETTLRRKLKEFGIPDRFVGSRGA